MKIEKLGQGDAALLAELERVAFDHPWSAEALAAELAKEGACAIAFRRGEKLAAAVLFSTVLDEAELLRIATAPECRRQGRAEALLEAGLERLRQAGICSVFLEVDEGNQPARGLYEKLGFEAAGRRPAYYKNGAAAVLYRRRLPAPPG